MANKNYSDDQVARLQTPQRNLLINGQMDIWQRGTGPESVTSSPTYEAADRWTVERTGSGAGTCQASSTVPNSHYRNSYRLNSSDTGAKNFFVWQRVEGDTLVPFIGKTMHLGAWVMSTAGSIDTGLYAYSNPSQSRDVWASSENLGNTEILSIQNLSTVNNVWQYNGVNFTVTAECEDGLAIGFRFGTLDEIASYYVTGARLHQGDSKLPWSDLRRTFGEELELCQRYYEIGYVLATGVSYSTSAYYGHNYDYKVDKRVAPTMTYANERIWFNGSWVTPDTFTLTSRVENGLGYGAHTGLTAYNGILCDFNYYADAEL